MPSLAILFLAVSCVSLVSQAAALARFTAGRHGTATEKLVVAGYSRTVACRIIAAATYVIVGAIQLAGDGTLSAEALTVYASVQLLWITNSAMDLRVRRTLAKRGGGR